MSYILEALKKAEAERELGAVPSLHSNTQAQASPGLLSADVPSRSRIGLGLLAGTVLAGAAVAAWIVFRPAPSAPTSALPSAPTATPALAAAADQPAPVQAQAPQGVAIEAPKPAIAAVQAPALAPKREARPVSVEDLPPDIKRALPALAISGAIHSAQASARMLIVNGQLLHEGDAVAPGLVLLSIGPKSALLRYRETRFTVSY